MLKQQTNKTYYQHHLKAKPVSPRSGTTGSSGSTKQPFQVANKQKLQGNKKFNKENPTKITIATDDSMIDHVDVTVLSRNSSKGNRAMDAMRQTEATSSIKKGCGLEPMPTTFSNARTVSYLDKKKIEIAIDGVDQSKKITDADNQNLMNFSATQKTAANSEGPISMIVPQASQQRVLANSRLGQTAKNAYTSIEMGCLFTENTQEGFNQRADDEELSCSLDSLDILNEYDASSIRPMQIPRVFNHQIPNSFFARKQQSALDKILATQPGGGTMSTMAGTATFNNQKTRHFAKWQLSPTRISDLRTSSGYLPCKVLPTFGVADISTSYDASRSMYRFGDCSVPEIVTNSSMCSNNGLVRSSQLFLNRDSQPNKRVTYQSCLQASYNCDEGNQSCGSSILEGQQQVNCSCCCQANNNMNSSNTLRSQLQSKFMLNLELVLFQEQRIAQICQQLSCSTEAWPNASLITLCEEWWQLTQDSANWFDVYKIYRDQATRKVLRRAMILECLCMVLTAFFNQRPPSEQHQLQVILAKMQRESQQNFMHIVCLVLQRMGLENCDSNMWATQLKQIVTNNLMVPNSLLLEEVQRSEIMMKHNCAITKLIKSLIKDNEQTVLFTNITFILQEIDKTHINRVRDLMIQSLSQETAQQQQPYWQEYPIESLECDESLQLPPSPVQHPPQYDEVKLSGSAYRQNNSNNLASHYLQQNLSTINEDCSNCSLTIQQPSFVGQSPKNVQQSLVPPYLPPIVNSSQKYTLVLDLDETLIHYVEPMTEGEGDQLESSTEHSGQFLVRPGVHKFLREMAKHYELVIFTAAMQDYADWVLDQLDTENFISYRLYRQHAFPVMCGAPTPDGQQQVSYFIKDLSTLGRDLSKILIVDNVAENFQLQPDNGVFIRTWIDDPEDNALEELAPLLKEIVVKEIPDVRDALRIFRLQMMDQVQRGIMKPQLSLDFQPPSFMTSSQIQVKQANNQAQALY